MSSFCSCNYSGVGRRHLSAVGEIPGERGTTAMTREEILTLYQQGAEAVVEEVECLLARLHLLEAQVQELQAQLHAIALLEQFYVLHPQIDETHAWRLHGCGTHAGAGG